METPEDVAEMLRLQGLGWGTRSIARELGISRTTVCRWLKRGAWEPYQRPARDRALEGLDEWLRAEFRRHRGNAEVLRQELKAQKDLEVSLRTVERAVAPLRQELHAEAKATVRFETPPGRQLQADFGQMTVEIGGVPTLVHLAVLTLGFSRRIYVAAWPCERQAQWLQSFEGAFRHFAGVPQELLLDNARALVLHHDVRTREVRFHPNLLAFCQHWGIRPRACAPYRARTKGKDERGVGYVKRNAIAGRSFASWQALEAHLLWWMREVADVRIHGTTGERPLDRFARDEARALQPLRDRPPFSQRRVLQRRVQSDCCVEVDTHRYSVPWAWVGREVTVELVAGELRVTHAGRELARHRVAAGSRQWVHDPAHFDGLVRGAQAARRALGEQEEISAPRPVDGTLLRSLSEYEAAIGGGA
ncbi:MAG: IS21 family transposase [Deltaproteobacteria bacterium]|nr:IS21 family transposase [Deltaproteobacteria bacterium]